MAKYKECKECGRKVLRISWSQLRTHMECRQAGHLARTGHKSKLQNTRNFFPGTVTDRVVRDWLDNEPEKNMNAMPDMVIDIIDREKKILEDQGNVMKWKDSKDRDEVVKVCQEAVTRILPSLEKFVLPFEYQADFKFETSLEIPNNTTGQLEQVLLLGYMDILVKDVNGDWAVWDVKHTKDNSYWKKTQGQLGFYDLGIDLMFGKPTKITGLLQPLCKEPVKPIRLDEFTRTTLLSQVATMANDVWAGDMPPRDDMKFCTFCPVKHACPKFKPKTVDGKLVAAFM